MKALMKTVACIGVILATGASAQEPAPNASISVELNTVGQVETGCQLTFLTSSGYEQGIENVVFETVLIDTDGAVMLMTLFDFGSLPPARPRVRQFVIPGQDCATLGRILINGVTSCSVSGLNESACEAGLTVSSRTDIELIG